MLSNSGAIMSKFYKGFRLVDIGKSNAHQVEIEGTGIRTYQYSVSDAAFQEAYFLIDTRWCKRKK